MFRTAWPFFIASLAEHIGYPNRPHFCYWFAHVCGSIGFGVAHKSNLARLIGHTPLYSQWKYKAQSLSQILATGWLGYILFPLSFTERVIVHQCFNAVGICVYAVAVFLYYRLAKMETAPTIATATPTPTTTRTTGYDRADIVRLLKRIQHQQGEDYEETETPQTQMEAQKQPLATIVEQSEKQPLRNMSAQ